MSQATSDLTPVQEAVLLACAQHFDARCVPVSADAWWRAEAPFAGWRAAFGDQLRALADKGLLHRRTGRRALYELTVEGRTAIAALRRPG